jgi:hypothetical protein
MKVPIPFYNETGPLLFQINIKSAGMGKDVMSSSIVVTFTNEPRHVFGLGDFQRWEREGIRGRFLKGKDPQGGREGRPIEDAIIAHPILYLRDGVGFFRADRKSDPWPGSNSSFRSIFIKKSKFIKVGSVLP